MERVYFPFQFKMLMFRVALEKWNPVIVETLFWGLNITSGLDITNFSSSLNIISGQAVEQVEIVTVI